ncbi:hypothetical protein GQ43DRAFT_381263 [Delitschia confertaspora ATCC 74209]|uniref:Putative phospholipase n=1 Tax=Delitschia confertaspora ATCC 74209 TaxID=1513339 RepID=A0A9P4JD97_9PLEO|nr:hypothetical protein GQ43DRAFT_381263 [Delitschia confertaspora ATCC 74209]
MGWLNRLNPTPAFPPYTGPYKVGSAHVEIPTADLECPSPAPDGAQPTVAFRIFYPCQQDSKEPGVRWIPDPQREYIGAYARFLGANSVFANSFAIFPQLLYYITIPVHRDAHILEPPTQNKRWPVMVFSHGLGGSMNAYSHLVGSLASHGIVVIAPDHRDGSSPISFVSDPKTGKSTSVEYRRLPHKPSTEVYEGRDEQLRIRLWELGLIHSALIKLDSGLPLKNLRRTSKHNHSTDTLSQFTNLLSVRDPGSISYAGHSFGAASMVQFIKSTFYHKSTPQDSSYKPLFTPSPSSDLVRQITPSTSVTLLDLWTLPLQSPGTAWLREKPMPSYHSPEGGSRLLAILSEAFYKWSANLNETIRTVAKPKTTSNTFPNQPGPHIFYPVASAHLSQSDFGVLFAWVTTKIFGAKEPERVLKLNVRAILQTLRNSGVEVAETSFMDREVEREDGKGARDEEILSREKGVVRDWISLGTEAGAHGHEQVSKGPADAVVEGEVLGEVVQEEER